MLELLACSRVRRSAISLLLKGKEKIDKLADASGSSKANTIHLIEPLLKTEMVVRDGNVYQLSEIGRAHAIVLQDTLDAIGVLEGDFWKSHDITSIPDELMRRIGDLKGGEVVCPNGDILKAQHNFVDLVRHAKVVYGVSSVFFQEWPEMILGAIKNGAEVHLILDPSIKRKLPQAFLEAGFDLQFKPCKAAFTVADNTLSLGLFAHGGGYDPTQDFICCSERAESWGKSLYYYFMQ